MSKNLVNLNIDGTNYSLRPYAICNTASSTAAKTVSISDFSLCEGATVCVKFAQTNTAVSPSLNVNNTGAKAIKCKSLLKAGDVNEFIYDGTNWILLNEAELPYLRHFKYSEKLDYGTTTGESWWSIGMVSHTDNSAALYSIRAYAHSSAIFTVSKGYGDAGNITVLQSQCSKNASYPYLKGIRLLSDGTVQIKLNNGAQAASIDITALSADGTIAGINSLYEHLILHDSESTVGVIHEIDLVDAAIIAKKFVGDVTGNATTATTAINIKQNTTGTNAQYPLLLAPANQSTTTDSATTYFDTGVSLNPSSNILSGAKVYESLIQWGNTNISAGLSPLDAAMDGQWSSNRLSFMPASGINIEYSTDGGTTWTDYGLTDSEKRKFVTTGLSYILYPGKNTTRQKINSDRVRVTITAEAEKTYFSLKKIYMYISQNGASGCKVLIEKSQCGSDTTFTQVGEYSISGWSGWNSIPLIARFGGSDGQTANIRRLRFTYYFTTYGTDYGETNDKLGVFWSISKLNMIGETSWDNSGGNLPTTGHIYSYDINKNTTFPANLTVKGNTTLGDATTGDLTITTGDLTLKTNTSGAPSIIFQRGETNDSSEDWKLTDVGGYFKIQNRNSGNTWVDVLSLASSSTKTLTSSYSVLPSTTDALDLGSSSKKWRNVYATTFNGTATKANDSDKLGGTDASAYALKTDITNLVDLTNNQTITGLKKFQSTSTSDNLTGVSLILQNNGWIANMSTALDFYNGTMYNVPNSRISTLMNGAGSAGGTMIFSTQTKHESTIPNPNELVERMRINDQGLVKISGDLEVTGNITGTVAKANDSDKLGGVDASAYALKTDIETLEEATTAQIQNIFK